jgi:hypothetical protein
MNNVSIMLIICGVILIIPGVVLIWLYNENGIERKCHYNLVNDGETGMQIKQVKPNGFNTAYSNTGANSVFIGSREAE